MPTKKKRKASKKRKVGRDAETGEFIPIAEAKRRKKTAIVQTIKKGKRGKAKPKK